LVPLTQTSQEAEHWQALDAQPTIGSGNIWYTQAGILLQAETDKSSRTTFRAFTYKTLML
jgi:hypothetical protein